MENSVSGTVCTSKTDNLSDKSAPEKEHQKRTDINKGREHNKDNSNAKKRWQILKQALLQRRKAAEVSSGDAVSVRRFATFELLSTRLISTSENEHLWLQYTCSVFPEFSVDIRHLSQQVKVDDLIGFNNTGNVCVWPSEEVLSYYCLKNKHLFRNQNVCELGGGMTCLAGVIVAACSETSHVLLTDGNENSVNNLHPIMERNKSLFGKTEVSARELKWNERDKFDDLSGQYDHIICADCLFFDQYRQDLVDTIDCLLKPGGRASIFAPHRGTTLQSFCDLSKLKFSVDTQQNYDATLWQKHQQMLTKGTEVYDENIHYPIFITLTKLDDAKKLKTK